MKKIKNSIFESVSLAILKIRAFYIFSALGYVVAILSLSFLFYEKSLREDPKLIAIDSSGTRFITRADDPIFDLEAINFIKHFISLTHSFTPETFDPRFNEASELMTKELWIKSEASIRELQKKVRDFGISMNFAVEKISTDKGEYSVKILQKESSRLKVSQKKASLKIKIRKLEKRTAENPWGLEIESEEETLE